MQLADVDTWTPTPQVQELSRLSLDKPVKLFVDSNTDHADNLQQEFVRIRSKMEEDRPAVVTGAHTHTHAQYTHAIVFTHT